MTERKPVELGNNYLSISGVSVVGLTIIGYLLYNKIKKPNLSHANTKIELKGIKKFLSHIYIHMVEKYMKDLKESVYQSAVISALAICFTMIGKSLIKMSCCETRFRLLSR